MSKRDDMTRMIQEGLGPDCSHEDADEVYCFLRTKNKIFFSPRDGLVLDDDVDLYETLLQIQHEKLTAEDYKTINHLRGRGFAVAIFAPSELNGVDPEDVENAMVSYGAEAIDDLRRLVQENEK